MKQERPLEQKYLDGAMTIGIRLCRDALWSDSRCNWLGASMEVVGGAWTVVQKSFGADLYSGTSGIGLFLAELFALTAEKVLRRAAEGSLKLALSRAAEFPVESGIGFYSGLTGVGYAAIRVGEKLGAPAYVEQGIELIDGVIAAPLKGQGVDVVSGCAGAIPVLLGLGQKFGKPEWSDAAVRCAQYLLATAKENDGGWSWDTLGAAAPAGQKHLTGFSHGTGGIGWAFLELWNATGERKFRDAAERAFQYERHWFNAQFENWPDFRGYMRTPEQSASGPGYSLAWCHGAPGIGLSRVRAYELTSEGVYRQEAEAAIRTTARSLEQGVAAGQPNYCMCHGACGNAELMLESARVFGREEHLQLAERVGQQALDYQATGALWPCGVMGAGETPGLMLGTAGIGYFLLRLYSGEAVPSLAIVHPDLIPPGN